MTDQTTTLSAEDDVAVQVLSNAGAQCGDCGDQPGDRACPNCESCRSRYVADLRAAGWAPGGEELTAEVNRLSARVAELESDADLLAALQAAGVDNWEGYDDALEHLAP